MRHSIRRQTGMAVFAAAGLAMGSSAMAQHALDANLSATQGRINPRANGVEQQIRYNNAVINGTAPNGASFRGSVGYQAPDQFGGSVGSDTLYNFRRDSFTSGLAAGGVRGSDALRYQFSLSTGQSVPSLLASQVSSVDRSGTVSKGTSGASGSALRSTADFLTSQSFRPTLVGVRQDSLGAEEVARASPLLGVSWVKTAESPLGTPTAAPTVVPGVPPPDSLTTPPGVAPTTVPGTGALTGVAAAKSVVSPFTGLETSARGVKSPTDHQATGDVDLHIAGANTGPMSSVHNQLETRFREGYDHANAPKPATPDTTLSEPVTYDMQMERLHRLLSGKPEPLKEERTPDRAPDGSVFIPKPKPSKPTGDQPAGEKPLDLPGVVKPVAPKPAGATTPPSNVPVDQNIKALDGLNAMTPEFLRGLKKVQEKKIDHYVEPAPLAGADTSPDPEGFRILMREGEALMADSRFFDAEDRFVRAIAGSPRDPMARAARMHAQMGAGLYLSAAANLRSWLAAHPDLASTRYADRLLPSADRCKIIAEQLADQEKKSESALGRESALLFAYLGYQRGDAKMVTDGLAEFEKRAPPGDEGTADRALLALVRAAWTMN